MDWLWLSLYHALAMLWATFWALVLGFTISGVLQVFVSKERMSRAFGQTNLKSVSLATGLENTGSYAWTVTGPATSAAVLKVLAHDAAGHTGADVSNAPFTITGTAAIEDPPPGALALGPIQPNPAHGTAWIDFELPQAMRARLSILDLEGREVAVLADGELAAGSHAMTWVSVMTPPLDAP